MTTSSLWKKRKGTHPHMQQKKKAPFIYTKEQEEQSSFERDFSNTQQGTPQDPKGKSPMSFSEINMNKKKKKIRRMKRKIEEMKVLERCIKTQNEMLTKQSMKFIDENERLKVENEQLQKENDLIVKQTYQWYKENKALKMKNQSLKVKVPM
jgi:hypothetical protein